MPQHPEAGGQSVKTWFAAHIILYIQLKDQPQKTYPVWENVVLIEARSEEEAFAKAEQRGRADAGDEDGTLTWGGEPARWVFGAVRKLTKCEDDDQRPGDGTEVTYLEMQVRSEKNLRKLLRSAKVGVILDEGFPEEATPAYRENGAGRPSLRFLEDAQEALHYLQQHTAQIFKAVIISQAVVFSPADGLYEARDAGIAIYLLDGRIRFLPRDIAEQLLNDGVFRKLNIRLELQK
jgi:hypothetical protein